MSLRSFVAPSGAGAAVPRALEKVVVVLKQARASTIRGPAAGAAKEARLLAAREAGRRGVASRRGQRAVGGRAAIAVVVLRAPLGLGARHAVG